MLIDVRREILTARGGGDGRASREAAARSARSGGAPAGGSRRGAPARG